MGRGDSVEGRSNNEQGGMTGKIIDYIRTNRVSTTEVADCLGKSGLFEGARPLNPGKFAVGVVKWVYAYDESNWSVHEQVRDVSEGDVVLVETFNCGDRAVIGELVSKYVLLYRRAAAIVSNAKFRDGSRLIREGYPIWCAGLTPVGCFNKKNRKPLDEDLRQSHRRQYDGSIAVCDDSGVVVIPRECHTEDFYGRLVAVEEQEDLWFDCLDRRKWDTYDIVCLRRYESEGYK